MCTFVVNSINIGVDTNFLDTTFAEFKISKGFSSVPDVAGILDTAMGDKNQMQELTPSDIFAVLTCARQVVVDGSITA